MPDNKRIPGLDLVRCVAIFLVVLQHSWTMLDLDQLSGTFQLYVYSTIIYGVPLFIILSGALNLRSVEKVQEFYKKRYVRIIVPFLIWGTVTYVISAVMSKYAEIDSLASALRMYIPFLLTGKINEAYWFVYLITAIYLVTPLLQRLFCLESKYSSLLLLLSISIWLGFVVLGIFNGLLGIFVTYLGFYILGCAVLRYLPKSGTRLLSGVIGTVVFVTLNIWLHRNGQVIFLVKVGESISIFMLLSGIDFNSALTHNLSRYSFLIYLTHFIIIRAMYTILPNVFIPVWYMPVIAALITIGIEYIFCLILERFIRLPLNLKLLGI